MARERRMVQVVSSKTGSPLVRDKQQRNSLCDCGSKKKAKKCCGATLKYYDTGKVKAALKIPEKEKSDMVDTLHKLEEYGKS